MGTDGMIKPLAEVPWQCGMGRGQCARLSAGTQFKQLATFRHTRHVPLTHSSRPAYLQSSTVPHMGWRLRFLECSRGHRLTALRHLL